ncbi:hypothetical protein [Streptococcus oralis]|uniref:hypothetical protein n=1 Tax=Streptococcus oralis TaxID=1303 RepID=UPI001CC1C13A|nr:hypothetical protein [Streptococcus oralis]MBZ2097285.1 hypothetical protein [Streptococcus oralis]MBZ2102798.1 hypothetical protein [Streptococcus oralis]
MKVHIKDKQGLQTHSTNAVNASRVYSAEISAYKQELHIATDQQFAEAVEAFTDRINTISKTLYEDFPLAMEKYGTLISNYIEDVNDAGFAGSSVIKTKDTDIESIGKWLTEDTKKKFDSVKESLDSALTTAKDALAQSPRSHDLTINPSTESIQNDIIALLGNLKKDRDNTHEDLASANTTFSSELAAHNSTIVTINSIIANGASISSLSIEDTLSLIKNGQLTKDNMYLIGSIQNSGDGAALKEYLIKFSKDNELLVRDVDQLSDEEKKVYYEKLKAYHAKLGGIDTTDVSGAMMDLIYGEVIKNYSRVTEGSEPEMEVLRSYVEAIANQDLKKSSTYFEKLIYAGDRHASLIGVTATALVPKVPDSDASQAEFDAYDRAMSQVGGQLASFEQQMAKAGRLTNLFEAMYGLEVGKSSKNFRAHNGAGSQRIDTSVGVSDITFNKNTGDFSFNIKKGAMTVQWDTQRLYSSAGVQNEDLLLKIKELPEKRQKEMISFVTKAASLAPIPGVSTALDTISSVVTMDGSLSSYIRTGDKAGKYTFGDLYKEKLGSHAGNALTLASSYEKIIKYDKELQETRDKLKNNLFDIGGSTYQPNSSNSSEKGEVKYNLNYDLQSILKIDDLQKNGVRGYIYDKAGGDWKTKSDQLKAFDKYTAELYKQGKLSEDTYDLFRGEQYRSPSEIGINKVYDEMGILQKNNISTFGLEFRRENYLTWHNKIEEW